MAFLACVLLLAALLSPATVITGAATTTALDGAHSSSVVTKRLSRRALTDATFVAEFRRPSVARRLSAEVAQPAAASPPGDVKLAPSQLSALVALTGWEAAEMCSQWMGVICDGRGMVTDMNLGGQGLAGPIPMDAFCNLTALQELELSFSPLTGSLEFLDCLPALQYLDLHATELTGEIPVSLGKATALSYLDLSFNGLTGSLEFLDCLPALQSLYAPVLLHFTSPCVLDPLLKTLKIARLFIPFLPHMPDAQSLLYYPLIPLVSRKRTQLPICPPHHTTHGSDLLGTALTGEIPASLGKATALTYLSLGHIDLAAGELPASLSALTNLAHLYVTARVRRRNSHIPLGSSNPLTSLSRCRPLVALLHCTTHPPCSLHIPHRPISTPPTMFSPHQPPCSLPTTRLTLPPLPRDVTAPDSLTTLFSPARSSPFPADWTALTSLNTLRAAGNGFSGSLPTTISTLTALSELDLSQNALVGSLPVLPSSLVSLSLSHNALEGPFSASPAAPHLLEVMKLSHNRFTWPTPASFSGLAALAILDVSYNDLSGPIPPSLANLPALVNVDISQNALSGGLDVLARMTNISTLNIGSCNLSGAFPAPLAQLALAELDISNNSFTGPFPSAILSAPQYRKLNLSANNFSGPLPAQLTTLTTLNSFDISHNQFTGVVPPAVFTLPSLTAL
ncbi:unnamed protein product, partial [Closterium sp. NIES-65]